MTSEFVERCFLEPGEFVDSDSPEVVAFARKHTDQEAGARENAVRLYYAVRDGFRYNPYRLDLRRAAMKASDLLSRTGGYCGEKSALLAACARAAGIPSRLGFAIVRNHIGTERLEHFLKTDKLVFHGYTELYLDGSWKKATPAFNRELCERMGVQPLEFDGKEDSIFQEFDREGGKFMEYLHDYGTFADVPRELFVSEIQKHYPHFFVEGEAEKVGIFFAV